MSCTLCENREMFPIFHLALYNNNYLHIFCKQALSLMFDRVLDTPTFFGFLYYLAEAYVFRRNGKNKIPWLIKM